MNKLSAVILFFGCAAAQFDFFNQINNNNNNNINNNPNCDVNKLRQLAKDKGACIDEVKAIKMQAIREMQRYASDCLTGMEATVQKCSQPESDFATQNDLDIDGIFDCCYSTSGSSTSRKCEFAKKGMPGEMGVGFSIDMMGDSMMEGGKMGHKSHESTMSQGPSQMALSFMQGKTLADVTIQGIMRDFSGIDRLSTCVQPSDPFSQVNPQVMQVFRKYKDQMIAKLYECGRPIIEYSSKCTDIPPQNLSCMLKAFAWKGTFMDKCIMACGPNSLDYFCNLITGQSQSQNFRAQSFQFGR